MDLDCRQRGVYKVAFEAAEELSEEPSDRSIFLHQLVLIVYGDQFNLILQQGFHSYEAHGHKWCSQLNELRSALNGN